MRSYIDSQISELEAARDGLKRQALEVDARLRAFYDMREQLGDGKPVAAINGHAPPCDSAIPSEMTPQWRKILAKLNEDGHSFGAQEIVAASEAVGEPTKTPNARGQLFQWQKKKLIRRIRKGKYNLTPKGVEIARTA
jgi:hypothetical protein